MKPKATMFSNRFFCSDLKIRRYRSFIIPTGTAVPDVAEQDESDDGRDCGQQPFFTKRLFACQITKTAMANSTTMATNIKSNPIFNTFPFVNEGEYQVIRFCRS